MKKNWCNLTRFYTAVESLLFDLSIGEKKLQKMSATVED